MARAMHSVMGMRAVGREPGAVWAAGVAWVIALGIGGCGATPRDEGVVWEAAAADVVPSAAVVYRPGPWVKMYAMEETKPRVRSVVVKREASAGVMVVAAGGDAASSPAGVLRWTIVESRGTSESELKLARTNLLERRSDGTVALVETINHEDGSLTRFEPPAVLWPGVIVGRDVVEEFAFEGEATVRDVKSPDKVKQRGAYRQELKIGVRAADEEWAGGPSASSRLTMEISGATVTREMWIGIDPVRGIVAERQVELVEFGPLTIRERRAALREMVKFSNDQMVK